MEIPERRIGPGDWDEAVADVHGPQLVVAGPGTGKTEFLVRRAAHLIGEVVERADRVLLLTFSRRAAADLRRRVAEAVGRPLNRVDASTFHSFAGRLLEKAHDGRPPALLTGPEQVKIVSDLLRREDPAAWPLPLRGLLDSRTLADDVTDFLLRCSDRLIGPDDLAERAAERPEWRALPGFYRRYLAELHRLDRIDYGTLLARAVELSRGMAEELAELHPFVLADEYQDTSPAQAELLEAITARHRNITVAADPYQSVYSFRGAELGNVADFPVRFRGRDGTPGRRLVLTTSFRVPNQILDAALRVTSGGRLPGEAGPVEPAPHQGSVEAYVFDQESAEAEWIASEIERLHLTDALPYRRMAVLVRSKRHLLPELSRALARRSVPHDPPDVRLVDHPAVRLVFDLARAAVLHAGAAHAELDRVMHRLLLGPLFSLSIGAERQLVRDHRRSGRGWPDTLRAELGEEGAALADLVADPAWAAAAPAIEGFWAVWEGLPQLERFVHDPSRRGDRAAWAAFAQVLERQAERDRGVSLIAFWEMTADEDFEATPLLSYDASGGDRLTLTTLHQAKGLEFDVVFVADAAEGVFPDLRRGVSLLQTHALSPALAGSAAALTRFRLQEEMRLAYTATTRARLRVVWTATAAGIDEAERRPSRFLPLVAGVESVADLGAPGRREREPVTWREAQAHLRRLLVEPTAPAASRLAAASVLANPPGGEWDATRFAGVRAPGPDSGVIPEGFRLSPSQADAFASCPRNYVFERRLGIGEVTSASASFGSLVHRVLQLAEDAAHAAGRPRADIGEVLEVLDRVWDEQADFGSAVFDRRWKAKAEEALRWLYENWPADSREPIALEHELEIEIDGRVWSGRADRVERTARGTVRIIDFKTGKTAMPIEEAKASVQLGFYLLASRSDPRLAANGGPAEAELWYPRYGGPSWRRAFDPDNLPAVEQTLLEVGRGVAAEDWRATFGDACQWCKVKLVCPLWPEGREAYAL